MSDRATLGLPADDEDELFPPADWSRPAPMSARARALWTFAAVGAVLAAGRIWLAPELDSGALHAFATIFVAISVQALPFLVFGVALSAAISAFVPPAVWRRILPRNTAAAVPVAGTASAVLPGCECASVPVAGSLMARGVAPAAALTFLLAAPAINPVVMVATAVAFPGEPRMVLARFLASWAAAVTVGWIWLRFGRPGWITPPARPRDPGAGSWERFRTAMRHDLMHAGGFLVVGALVAAALHVVVPPAWISGVAGTAWAGVATLALLAIVMSICSEADAFVAASMTQFSPTAQLTFMVVGPMVDLKLMALQAGFFGRRFVLRFVPLILSCALTFSVVAGWWLL